MPASAKIFRLYKQVVLRFMDKYSVAFANQKFNEEWNFSIYLLI